MKSINKIETEIMNAAKGYDGIERIEIIESFVKTKYKVEPKKAGRFFRLGKLFDNERTVCRKYLDECLQLAYDNEQNKRFKRLMM